MPTTALHQAPCTAGELPQTATFRPRHSALFAKHSRLQGQRLSAATQAEALTTKVAAAKTRLDSADEVAKVLQKMQSRANGRAVGVFERLLTAVLQDVLPEEGEIKLTLELSGNAPALDVAVSKDGKESDVLDDNGGALTNVVCTGLKFAALARTTNRQFIVLDEPDCWLKPERVPAFMKVLADVASQTGTQTMFVAHHPQEFFPDNITLVHLTRNADGKVSASAVEPTAASWGTGIAEDGTDLDAVPGIRAIELENFKAHEHTVIPCFPGATALIGDNNLGKSAALVSALKAVAFGESTDKALRFGTTKAKVTVHLESHRRLVWTREPKRNPVVFYELWEGDTKVREGKPPGRNQVPEWVVDALGIRRVDGLDLQLCSQKKPVFLLDETASTRARILSVGRESSHVITLMQKWDEVKRSDRDTVRTSEPEIQKLTKQLDRLDALDAMKDVLDGCAGSLQSLEDDAHGLTALSSLLVKLVVLQRDVSTAENEVSALANLPVMPVLHDTAQLERLAAKMDLAQKRLLAKALPLPVVVAPVLHDLAPLALVAATIDQTQQRLLAKELPFPSVQVPTLHDLLGLTEIARNWTKAQGVVAVMQAPGVEALLTGGLPAVPALEDVRDLEDIAARWVHAEKRLAIIEVDAPDGGDAYALLFGAGLPLVPSLADVRELESLAVRLAVGEKAVATAKTDVLAAEQAFAAASAEFAALMESMGGECPLCGSAHAGEAHEH